MTVLATSTPPDLDEMDVHLRRATRERTAVAMWACTCDAATLLAEVKRVTEELARARGTLRDLTRELARERHLHRLDAADATRLCGAARATVAAAAAHEPNATGYVAGELARRGLMPPPGARPHALLAQPDLLTRVLRDQYPRRRR
jgi:hypothetical protein